MKVLKFGGTSLGNAQRIKSIANIVKTNSKCIVVCSAMTGMTNQLIRISKNWESGKTKESIEQIRSLESNFIEQCEELFGESFYKKNLYKDTKEHFEEIIRIVNQKYSFDNKDIICGYGEIITSEIFNHYLNYIGLDSILVNALEFVCLNNEQEPIINDISKKLENKIKNKKSKVIVTQGFICLDSNKRVTNLKRGGSDYTATLIGAAINASAIEIWTDIDGLHNNDPRYVEGTQPIHELSYTEASELAYFGAKILHPSCIRPAREKNIPVILKNSLQPDYPGTLIQTNASTRGIKAISAKDNITILRVNSGRMFNAYGFLKKVFEIFELYKTPVDVVTTSEVSVSITIEDLSKIDKLINELKNLGRVNIEQNRSIICVVGDMLHPGYVANIMQLVKPFDIRMISLGASSSNITLVLPQDQKKEALNALHKIFSKKETDNSICAELINN